MSSLSFLTPLSALVALGGFLPLVVALRRDHRGKSVRGALGLADPPPDRSVLVALVAVPVLVGLAAAQPVVDREREKRERVDAEILFAFDTTRSMAASDSPQGATRLDRAKRIANKVRAAAPYVRAGAASLNDRALPYVFPTINASTFRATLARAVAYDRPPPSGNARVVTDLNALAAIGEQDYFSPGSRKRLLVVLTDGETQALRAELSAALKEARIRTILVHVWRRHESIFMTSRPEPQYRADPSSRETLRGYATAVDGVAFSEGQVPAIIERVSEEIGDGPTSERSQRDLLALGPYLMLAAALPLALIIRRRNS